MTSDDAHVDQSGAAAAQGEDDQDPELRAILAEAAQSSTVRRNRRPSTSAAEGQEVPRVRIVIRPEPAAPGFPPVIQEALGVTPFGRPADGSRRSPEEDRAFRTDQRVISLIDELRKTDPDSVSGIAVVDVPERAYWLVEEWAGFESVTWSMAPMFADDGNGPSSSTPRSSRDVGISF